MQHSYEVALVPFSNLLLAAYGLKLMALNLHRNFCQGNTDVNCPVAKGYNTKSHPAYTSVRNTPYKHITYTLWTSSKSSFSVMWAPFQLTTVFFPFLRLFHEY